jgi:hypothetical protein
MIKEKLKTSPSGRLICGIAQVGRDPKDPPDASEQSTMIIMNGVAVAFAFGKR